MGDIKLLDHCCGHIASIRNRIGSKHTIYFGLEISFSHCDNVRNILPGGSTPSPFLCHIKKVQASQDRWLIEKGSEDSNSCCCWSLARLHSIYYTQEKTGCKQVILPELTNQVKNLCKSHLFVLHAK
jgi:hypothetical protein